MTSKKLIVLCLLSAVSATALAQIHSIPFESKGNTIELSVVNTSNIGSSVLTVSVVSFPEWIRLNRLEEELTGIPKGESQPAVFLFDALDTAPIGQTGELVFSIRENGTVIETKSIRIKSEAPESFELFNNYPNPFNPSTTIAYQLPGAMTVNLQIFNILGQQVAELVNGRQEAGKYQLKWDARSFASGMYIYQIIGRGKDGQQFMAQSKMLLIK